ncbi:ABC transporter permease [Streptomyces sp. NPDC056405]|uniref:ABC transporter permease n=1 Tax=Streptomyces sp. NPDC056405 TaxID=3345811 RepID=UPI0035E03128
MSVATVRRRPGTRHLRHLSGRGKLFTVSLVVLGVLVVTAVLAPLLAPHDPEYTDLGASLAPPGLDHPLGTDFSGRDTLSRLIHGARTSLLGPLGVVAVSSVLGAVLGLVSAWRGGWVDTVISRGLDLVFAFPGLLLAMVVVAVSGPGLLAPTLAMGVAYTPYVARLVRAAAIGEQLKPYITAYRVQGFSGPAIALRHVLPNVSPVLLAQSTLNFGYALLDLAVLSFLGLGVQPPTPDWGSEIQIAQQAVLAGSPLSAAAPVLAVMVTVVVFTVVGETLADRVARRER